MKRTAPPPRPRGPAILFLLTGLAAVIGGGLLVVRPDGGWLGMSRALLEETPFGSFLIPGLVLALVVGGSQLAAGLALVQRRSNDVRLALAAALVLAGWIAIQALMLGVAGVSSSVSGSVVRALACVRVVRGLCSRSCMAVLGPAAPGCGLDAGARPVYEGPRRARCACCARAAMAFVQLLARSGSLE